MKILDKVLISILIISFGFLLSWLFMEIWTNDSSKYYDAFWHLKRKEWYNLFVKFGQTAAATGVISLFSVVIRAAIEKDKENDAQ